MLLSRRCSPLIHHVSRRFVQNLPHNVRLEVDPTVNEQLKSENRKLAFFKEHKGKFHHKSELPKKLEETINTVLSDIEPQRLKADMKLMHDHLEERQLPIEKRALQGIAQNVVQNFIQTDPPMNTLAMSPEERERLHLERKWELVKRLKSSIYNWQPINFDEYKSKVYLATNFASHYAMMVQILNEIKQREDKFLPVRLLDYGSGTGSVMWAAMHVWGKKSMTEILNVDKSRAMNNLSQLLLQGGQSNRTPIIPGVIYRQFLPHGRDSAFDLVVADHTLFEFENRFDRFKAVKSLWYNVRPGGFLILVERGNIHGYGAIMEARENILSRLNASNPSAAAAAENGDEETSDSAPLATDDDDDDSSSKKSPHPAHVFSPCPHDSACPKKELNIPCRIATRYRPLQIFDLQSHSPSHSTVQMSYVVIKKAERDPTDAYGTWPRVIEPIIDRRKHQHVRLCCPNGKYVNVPISKNKHGVALHRLSHHAAPGDIFPVIGEVIEDRADVVETEPTPVARRRRAFRA